MQTVDIILTHATIVTMNTAFDVFLDGAVAVKDAQIIAVGTTDDILADHAAERVLDCHDHYILPGLVNAHTHVPMTLLRGLADDLRLDVWLMGYIMPTEREFVSPEFCRLGTKLGCAEMIRSGITTFADMYYHESVIAQTVAEIGMRGVLGQTILKFPAPDAESYEDSLAYTREFIEKWLDDPLITPAVAPHAPYSSTKELLKHCAQIGMQYDVPVLIHVSEMEQEEDNSFQAYGMRVVPWLRTTGLFNAKVLAAHCVHINNSDMQTLYEHDTTVAHNPSSNLKLASGIAPIKEMLDNRLIVGIGTDGPASNNDLDMFEEIRLAAMLAKTASNDPTALPAKQALLMATRQGAEALFIGDKTGTLESGKYADMIVVENNTLHNFPHFHRDPDSVYSQIVYAAKSTDVAHVMCHGQWLMQDRELLTIDVDDVMAGARAYAVEVDKFLAAHEGDVLSKLLAVGGVERAESFEVQVKAIFSDTAKMDQLLEHPDVAVLRDVRYRQYDTYFIFDDDSRVRYREDDNIASDGTVGEVRSRLTYTMPTKEREFDSAVLLSHSRFIAPADRPLRFYNEYFKGAEIHELHKERMRWHIHFQGVLYYVNVDQLLKPRSSETYIELKSRTWSLTDAQHKADGIQRMLEILEITSEDRVRQDYLDVTTNPVS